MPCTVTTNCSLCGQRMNGEYPQGLAAAVTALLNDHNELRKCHRELEEAEQVEETWKERHDHLAVQRNELKQTISSMRKAGALTVTETINQALSDTSTEMLLQEIKRRVG